MVGGRPSPPPVSPRGGGTLGHDAIRGRQSRDRTRVGDVGLAVGLGRPGAASGFRGVGGAQSLEGACQEICTVVSIPQCLPGLPWIGHLCPLFDNPFSSLP